jgi:TonB-linked SusC/RagA family outer membrane protein
MYKKYTCKLGMAKPLYRKIMLIMRLTTVILIASLMQLSAAGFAQKITLNQRSTTLESLLKEIRRQSGYDYYYGNKVIAKSQKLDVTVTNVSVTEALESILKGLPLTYEIAENMILIKKKEAPSLLDRIMDRFRAIDVKGKILDENGAPLVGATVAVKGTNRLVKTDINGVFFISGVDEKASLVITYIGYEAREVDAASDMGSLTLNVNNSKLDEIQVIGYGTTTQRLNTGNVSTVVASVIEKQPVTNVLSSLIGRVPGMFVQTANGLPGGNITVQIRGKSSIRAGSEPLYLIDGTPFMSTPFVMDDKAINGSLSPFNVLNPADIESISVLKDADATAIYGSRGANGVVLITTKKGQAGQVVTDVKLNQGFSKVSSLPKVLGLADYLKIRKEAFANDGLTPSSDPLSASYAPDLTIWDQTKSTDWGEYLLGGTGHSTDLSANISGGDKNTKFIFGSNYRTEKSVLPGTNKYERSGFHMSVQHTSANNRFSASMLTNYSADNNNTVSPSFFQFASNVFLPPNFPLYDNTGELYFLPGFSPNLNPLAQIRKTSKTKSENLGANATIGYLILPGLNLKTNLGFQRQAQSLILLDPLTSQNPFDPDYPPLSTTDFGDGSNRSVIIEPQIDYILNLRNSTFSALIGGTYQSTSYENGVINASNFSSESLLENILAASVITPTINTRYDYKYASAFARINYRYSEKYLVNVSIRRDGSSRFGPENRFGNFGAVSGAWIFSKEKWLESINWLTFGKLRASYGITGNDQISNYQYLNLYSNTGYSYQNIKGLGPSVTGNNQYRWETNKKLEFGLEVGLLKDRFIVNISRYMNNTGNQLVPYILPYTAQFFSYQTNLPADIENSGWEYELNTKNIETKNFKWTSTFNLTSGKSVLKDFPTIAKSGLQNQYKVGESLTRIYGYKYLGADAKTGSPLYQLGADGTTNAPVFADLFNTIGDSNPKYYGGFGNTIIYKSIQLDVFASFSSQQLKSNLNYPGGLYNNFSIVSNRWQTEGQITQIPRPTTQLDAVYNNYLQSSAQLFKTTYLRIKNISLSYSIPEKLSQKAGLKQVRFFAEGQNIITWWNKDIPLYDPESGVNIPAMRSVSFGLQVKL